MAADLQFAIRAVNEASAALNAVKGDLDSLGSAADNSGGHLDKAGSAMRSAGQSADQAHGPLRNLIGAFGDMAKIAGGIVIAKALMELPSVLGGVVSAASDTNESLSKMRTVFGESAASVEAFASTSANSMGLTKQATLEAAGTFGNLFTAIGMSKPAAADLSMSVVKLAADLASFNNIPVGDALEKLRAGLVGEAEPLRALGVNLTEVQVKAQAAAMGFKEVNGEFSNADKVMARYALILQQTGAAQGDFARTSDGLANQTRILQANFGDLQASIGEMLLPVVTRVVSAMNDAIPAIKAYGAAFMEVFGPSIAAGVSSAIDAVQGFIELMISGAQAAGDGISALAGIVSSAMGEVISVLSGAAETIYDLLSYLNPFATHSPSLVSQVQEGTDAIKAMWQSVPGALSGMKDVAQDLVKQQDDLNEKIATATANVNDYKAAIDGAKASLNEFKSASIAEEKPFTDAAKTLQGQIDALTKAKVDIEIAAGGKAGLTDTVSVDKIDPKTGKVTSTSNKTVDTQAGQQVKALQDQIDLLNLKLQSVNLDDKIKIGPLKDEIKGLTDTTKTLTFAEIIEGIKNSQSAIDTLTPKMNDEKTALDGYKQSLKDVTTLLGEYNKAIQDMTPKAGGGGGGAGGGAKSPLADMAKSAADMKDELDKAKAKAQELKDEFDEMKKSAVEKLDTIKDKIGTVADSFDRIKGAVSEVASASWDGIKDVASMSWDGMKDAWDNISPNIKNAASDGKNFISNLSGTDKVTIGLGMMSPAFAGIVLAAKGLGAVGIDMDTIKDGVGKIGSALSPMIKLWKGFFKDDIDAAKEAAGKVVAALVPLGGAFGDLVGQLTPLEPLIKPVGVALAIITGLPFLALAGALTLVLFGLKFFIEYASNTAVAVIDTFTASVDLLNKGIDLFKQYLGPALKDALSAIVQLSKDIIDAFKPAGTWLIEAGSAIVQGIIAGVTSAAPQLIQKMKDLAGDALDAAKGFLKIKSPSEVFRDEVGIPIVTGAVEGVFTGNPLLVQASIQMAAEAAHAGMQAVQDQLNRDLAAWESDFLATAAREGRKELGQSIGQMFGSSATEGSYNPALFGGFGGGIPYASRGGAVAAPPPAYYGPTNNAGTSGRWGDFNNGMTVIINGAVNGVDDLLKTLDTAARRMGYSGVITP